MFNSFISSSAEISKDGWKYRPLHNGKQRGWEWLDFFKNICGPHDVLLGIILWWTRYFFSCKKARPVLSGCVHTYLVSRTFSGQFPHLSSPGFCHCWFVCDLKQWGRLNQKKKKKAMGPSSGSLSWGRSFVSHFITFNNLIQVDMGRRRMRSSQT